MLVSGFHAGITPRAMADALRKTPGAVRWKLSKLGLASLSYSECGAGKRDQLCENVAARRADRAFQAAMAEAIKSGAENLPANTASNSDFRPKTFHAEPTRFGNSVLA